LSEPNGWRERMDRFEHAMNHRLNALIGAVDDIVRRDRRA